MNDKIGKLLGFWIRQKDTIAAMSGTDHRGLRLFISLLHANAPVIKRYWPDMNRNGVLDDFINTLDAVAYDTLVEGQEDGK
jgi:hypothetical protein